MEVNLHCAFITCKQVTINDTLMYSYTFCDLSSSNNFTVFSLVPVKRFDNLKQLQVADLPFNLYIQKNGTIKLKPVKEV